HPFIGMHYSNHALRSQLHPCGAPRERHSCGNRKWRTDLKVTATQTQIRKLATDRRIVLFCVRSVAAKPFAQLTRNFRRWIQETHSHLCPASLPRELRRHLQLRGRARKRK